MELIFQASPLLRRPVWFPGESPPPGHEGVAQFCRQVRAKGFIDCWIRRIDSNSKWYAIAVPVRRWLSLALLVGALFGLIGQGAAFAHVMPTVKIERAGASAPMSPDCAKMMGLAKPAPQPAKPCKGMTPDCVAKMGCAMSVALLLSQTSDPVREFRRAPQRHILQSPLVGRDTGPEPEPPTRLG